MFKCIKKYVSYEKKALLSKAMHILDNRCLNHGYLTLYYVLVIKRQRCTTSLNMS